MTAQSYNNVDFKLHTLGWKAFQDLSITIMTNIFGHDVQSFYDSHDGGRDGAFHGVWIEKLNGAKSGSFTVQCKFTSDYKKGIKVSDLKDDIEKAKRLAAKGLSDHYVLFTNAQLTGNQDESLREVFENIDGIESFTAYGKERISQIILESPKLRMLVPRIYGLGDLSQILDERAGYQAKAILDSLGDDISKFVLTEAFNKSAKALVEHGFVLLLGEPACGKSTIAASLALGALDEWGCSTFKICSSEEFRQHWNPNEPNRLFWIDDAFGATQVDWAATFGWARVFPHINTAIRNGAKVIFTSRDYIYKSAKRDLKETDLPVMKASQVVINVQDISDLERQQILYNHIKLGNQSKSYKAEIKPFLKDVAENKKFTPEIARRLGNKFFTQSLEISKHNLIDFVQNPIQFLIDILSSLEKQNISALAVIFMRAGVMPSPIALSDGEKNALNLLGGTLDGVISSLNFLKGSLTILNFEDDQHVWKFKHPSIRDAFAQYVANDVELLEIYLGGAPMSKLLQEVACAKIKMRGLKVIVPKSHYEIIIRRMDSFDKKDYYGRRLFNGFLTKRCDKQFLSLFLNIKPSFLDELKVRKSFYMGSDLDVLVKFFDEGLLPEKLRMQVVKSLHYLALNDLDTQFTEEDIKPLLKKDEFDLIKLDVCNKVLPELESMIEQISSDYDDEYEPEDHFLDFNNSLREYEELFYDSDKLRTQISIAKSWVEEEINTLASKRKVTVEYDDQNYKATMSSNLNIERSIFDDVDS
jgi:energy-coupling factor transporter ATP-binding protein EcfA2